MCEHGENLWDVNTYHFLKNFKAQLQLFGVPGTQLVTWRAMCSGKAIGDQQQCFDTSENNTQTSKKVYQSFFRRTLKIKHEHRWEEEQHRLYLVWSDLGLQQEHSAAIRITTLSL